MNTTPGEWIVEPAELNAEEGVYLHKIVAVGPDGDQLVALVPNIADAALMSAAQKMMDALIDIAGMMNTSKEPISIEKINEVTSHAIEKIAAESGEM